MAHIARFAGLAVLLGFLAAPSAQASTHVSVQLGVPGPVVVAAAPPAYGGYWQPGYYVRTRFGYRWVPGYWVRSPYGRRGWGNDRWERGRRERDRRNWDRDRYRDNDRRYRNDDRDYRSDDRNYRYDDRRGRR